MSNEKKKYEQLLALIHAAVQKDNELRDAHQIGERFRFVKDRLQALQASVEDQLAALLQIEAKATSQQADDEVVVYIYLFNAQGILLPTWQKMLSPGVFYEYSVNRPIYADRSQVEAFIRSKTNKTQHGYVLVHVKKTDILSSDGRDSIGGELVKVKEGALKFDRFVTFAYGGHEYKLNASGELIKA